MITTEELNNVTRFFKITNHKDGKLNLKIDRAIINEEIGITLREIEALPTKICGLKSVKINAILATATVRYDTEIFDPQLWESLINAENMDEITPLINHYAEHLCST